jgi:hypothetical protein
MMSKTYNSKGGESARFNPDNTSDIWKEWFKDSAIVGCDPYFIKRNEFISELDVFIAHKVNEARIEELEKLEPVKGLGMEDNYELVTDLIEERLSQLKTDTTED